MKTYEFGADAGTLFGAYESGVLPEHWESAFRAIVADIASQVDKKPCSIYLCSDDRDADARNRLGAVLTRILRERIPGVILVDCDFLSVGLSGIVPHRDAIGFLDLLLYGTSLGVITQRTAQGAKVVGAGSFAVTKKSPFAMDAFVTARRYLVNQARCVLFVGPVFDDEENIHPIAGDVDVVALVRLSDRFDPRFLDPLEQKVASIEGVEARSIRVNTGPGAPARVPVEQTPEARAEPSGAAGAKVLVGGPGGAEAVRVGGRPTSVEGFPRGEDEGQGRTGRAPVGGAKAPESVRRARSSRAVRVIASLAAISAVVFVVWWLYLTRSVRERPGAVPETAGPPAASVETPPDSLRAETQAVVSRSAETGESRSEETVGEAIVRRDEPAAPQGGEAEAPRGGETTAAPRAEEDLLFVDTLGRYADQYVIHVSSFRGMEKAKEEASYLVGRGYPVFIYHVDTGSKGMWYRVYVGPYTARDEAIQSKIKLDENPRIRSTRVSKVPG